MPRSGPDITCVSVSFLHTAVPAVSMCNTLAADDGQDGMWVSTVSYSRLTIYHELLGTTTASVIWRHFVWYKVTTLPVENIPPKL
jgi:hypothetical protein